MHRPEDTLYLDVSGPVVRPGILIVSDNGRTGVEFGNIGTGRSLILHILDSSRCLLGFILSPMYAGDSVTKKVTIKNVSNDPVQVFYKIVISIIVAFYH